MSKRKHTTLAAINSRIAESKAQGFEPIILIINPELHVFPTFDCNQRSLMDGEVREALGLRVIYDVNTPDFFIVDNRSWVYQKF